MKWGANSKCKKYNKNEHIVKLKREIDDGDNKAYQKITTTAIDQS